MDSSFAIVNTGSAAWALEDHAQKLSLVLGLEVSETPARFNYLLGWEPSSGTPSGKQFIPYESILIASDKRLQAPLFAAHGVRTPQTFLPDTPDDVRAHLKGYRESRWVLKWPIGCGASGHRMVSPECPIPDDWPRPYILQEFISLVIPEVYRVYCVAGEIFGWNARRFLAVAKRSPWVAHAQGARYEEADSAPEAEIEARKALEETGLIDSFGCVDLLKTEDGQWLVLEVGTDGVYTHVDRDIGIGNIPHEIDRRSAAAFWSWIGSPPRISGERSSRDE